MGRMPPSVRSSMDESLICTSRLEGTTKMTPGSSGWCVASVTVRTGSVLRRERISPRWLGRVGSRCCAMTMGAGKSLGRVETTEESASMPPAEEPITTRCENDLGVGIVRLPDIKPRKTSQDSVVFLRLPATNPDNLQHNISWYVKCCLMRMDRKRETPQEIGLLAKQAYASFRFQGRTYAWT